MGWEIARSGAGVAIGLRDRAAHAIAQLLFALAIAARRSAAAGLTDRSSSNSTPFFPLMIFFALAGLGLATLVVQRRSIRS